MALLGIFLMFGTGMKTAHAGDLANSALYAALSGLNQGVGEYNSSYALYYSTTSTLYDAYYYQTQAKINAYYAYYYASYSSVEGAYEAYIYALNAYKVFNYAASYAYDAWYYDNVNYTYLSLLYGGYGAYYIAIAQYFAAYYCYGGIY